MDEIRVALLKIADRVVADLGRVVDSKQISLLLDIHEKAVNYATQITEGIEVDLDELDEFMEEYRNVPKL